MYSNMLLKHTSLLRHVDGTGMHNLFTRKTSVFLHATVGIKNVGGVGQNSDVALNEHAI